MLNFIICTIKKSINILYLHLLTSLPLLCVRVVDAEAVKASPFVGAGVPDSPFIIEFVEMLFYIYLLFYFYHYNILILYYFNISTFFVVAGRRGRRPLHMLLPWNNISAIQKTGDHWSPVHLNSLFYIF